MEEFEHHAPQKNSNISDERRKCSGKLAAPVPGSLRGAGACRYRKRHLAQQNQCGRRLARNTAAGTLQPLREFLLQISCRCIKRFPRPQPKGVERFMLT
jgi:hypothetical protein